MTPTELENGAPARPGMQRRQSSVYPLARYAERHIPNDDDDDDNELDEEVAPVKPKFKLGDPMHSDDTYLGTLRNKAGRFINCFPAQLIMTGLIIANALLLGVLTLDVVRFDPELLSVLEYLDLAILISFTIEFSLQLFYLGPSLIKSTWLVFDGAVITFSWALMGTSANVLRSFRIFRVFSLASKWTSMQQLFTAVGNTLPKMSNVAALLLLLFYAVTVFCTSLFAPLYDQGYLDYDYFGRLDLTFITLFQMLTTDTWLVIVRQVMDAQPLSYVFFYVWVSLTSIIIVNLIIAIICDAIIVLKESIEESVEEDAGKAFKAIVPMDALNEQQLQIEQTQHEMEVAIDELMLRVTVYAQKKMEAIKEET